MYKLSLIQCLSIALLAGTAAQAVYAILWRLGILAMLSTPVIALCLTLAPAAYAQVPTAVPDDTAQVQALLNAGGNVVLPRGIFNVRPLVWPANLDSLRGSLRLSFGGRGQVLATTLKLMPNQGKWARILTPLNNTAEERAITIADLAINMNRDNQSWQGGFDLEHQAAIFLAGKLNATVNNVVITNSAADSIYVWYDVKATLTNINCTDIFRGSPMVTGRDSVTLCQNFYNTRGGIDIEPNTTSDKTDVTLKNFRGSKLDTELTIGSKFYGEKVIIDGFTDNAGVRKPPTLWLFARPGSDWELVDSDITGRYIFRLPHARFNNVRFHSHPSFPNDSVIAAQWYLSGTPVRDVTLEMYNCSVEGPTSVMAIFLGVSWKSYNQASIINNLAITGCPRAIVADAGRFGYRDWQSISLGGIMLPDVNDGRP